MKTDFRIIKRRGVWFIQQTDCDRSRKWIPADTGHEVSRTAAEARLEILKRNTP